MLGGGAAEAASLLFSLISLDVSLSFESRAFNLPSIALSKAAAIDLLKDIISLQVLISPKLSSVCCALGQLGKSTSLRDHNVLGRCASNKQERRPVLPEGSFHLLGHRYRMWHYHFIKVAESSLST